MNSYSEIKLNDIVRTSTLYNKDPITQQNNIVAEFNRNNKESYTVEDVVVGIRIDVDQFRLVARNNEPELVAPTRAPKRTGYYFTGKTEDIGTFKQTDLQIGAHGRYLINVPQGKLVKAWEGTKPILLGEGPHVIRHQNFSLDKNPLVDLSDNVIRHGNHAIIRVPSGKLAKIWLGATPVLLDSRPEPYIYDDATFRIVGESVNGQTNYFVDATEKLVVHGSIKRILPPIGEAAIATEGGKTTAYQASDAVNGPIVKDSPTIIVDPEFLKTLRQTIIYPSQETQDERRKRNPNNLDAIMYETFQTSDKLTVGVNVLVAYDIIDPGLAVSKIPKNEIKKHIESVVVAHMLAIIPNYSSNDFTNNGQNAVKNINDNDIKDSEKSEKSKKRDAKNDHQMPEYQQRLNRELHDDLIQIGIKLTQLRLEPPKILNHKIVDELEQNSLLTAKKRTEVAMLEFTSQITQQQAAQAAKQKCIEMDREKQNKITQAQWESETLAITSQAKQNATLMEAKTKVEAAKQNTEAQKIDMEREKQNKITQAQWEAEALAIKSQAQQNATLIDAKTKVEAAKLNREAQTIEVDTKIQNMQKEFDFKMQCLQTENQLKLAYLEQLGKLYTNYPGLLERDEMQIQADGLKNIQASILSPEVVGSQWYTTQNSLGMFSGNRPQLLQKLEQNTEKVASLSLTAKSGNK